MYNPSVLIISKRKELSIRYKKILRLLEAETVIVENLSDATLEIKKQEFEFIIISDTIEENIKEFIKKVRILTCGFRPTVIAVSKSAELSDKLELLNAGADDFLSESMPNREFQARLNAHIRRHIENLTNHLTGFLTEKLTRKTLKRTLSKEARICIIYVYIDKLDTYKEIYGEIAGEKVLQTIGAIISSTLIKEDTVGHLSENSFLIFTNPVKAEKLAEYLVYAFDNVLDKFYSKYDFENNFIMLSTNSKEEKKTSLMKLTAAVMEFTPSKYKSEQEVIQSAINLIKPLKKEEKSGYIIDRPKLYGKVDNIERNKVLIMENDDAMGLLIETTCHINGFSAKVCEKYDDFEDCLKNFNPDLIILDWGKDGENNGIAALDRAKEYYKTLNKKMPYVIFSTDVLEKKEILSHGADYYIPKPYEISVLMSAIKSLLQ